MNKVNFVWLLWCTDKTDGERWVEEVFIDKVLAEWALRFMLADQGDRFHHYLQEKQIYDRK